jgi:hypothetical protein
VSSSNGTPPASAPRPVPALLTDRRHARNRSRSSGGAAPATIAPFALLTVASPTAITQASAAKAHRLRTRMSPATAAARTSSAQICVRFGPQMSATCPSGAVSSSPATAPTLSPVAIAAGLNPTERVRNSALVVR